jgi:hypothetical protein
LAYNIVLIIFGINLLNLLILFEDDTFKECGRSGQGGSIFVKNTEANFVIVNSESIKSHTYSSDGLFLYSKIENTLQYNFVLYCTISESYYSSGSPRGTITLYYGQIRIISTNSSNNVCYERCSFSLLAKNNSEYLSQLNYSTEDNYIHYCYILNNYASNYGCIGFENFKHLCEESNIINNYQGTSKIGTIYNSNAGSPNTIIKKCCLIKNNNIGNGTNIFFVTAGTMEVRKCKIQNGFKYGTSSDYSCSFTTYSNTEEGSECAAISNVGTKNVNTNEDKCKCTICDFEILHKLQKIYLNKQFYYK